MDVIQAAKIYASLGWHVLPVRGKVPASGDGWQHKTTNDVEAAEVLATIGDGIGVQLGPKSGIVDVECDSEEASKQLQELLGDLPMTPTFQSFRGCHYLFKWSENWPAPNKAVFKIGAIEFRTGNSKAAQSVFPPSGGREWIVDPAVPMHEFPAMEKIRQMYEEANTTKPSSYSPSDYTSHGDRKLNVERWLRDEFEIVARDEVDGVKRWFIPCPNHDFHTTRNGVKDCVITQEPDGTLGGHCFHQSCQMGDWQALKKRIGEPKQKHFDGVKEIEILDNIDSIINQCWGTKAQEQADEENDNDEDFCQAMVPPNGLIRQVFDYYSQVAYRKSNVMGLAVAMSLCQTVFGRRVRSHTDMRTNDYNLILATTGSGKEACESTVTKILNAADATGSHMLPPDVQSGNGLMHAIAANPCSIWVCDEFGKILQSVLDKKGNQHIKNIGNHLLKLYGKSNGQYGGAAHSQEIRNRVHEPHLVILGLSTGSTVFDCVTAENVSDGLLGRIAFWPVQDRPEPKEDMEIVHPSETLVETVRNWIMFAPGGGNLAGQNPVPETLRMSVDAKERWKSHAKQIDEKMRSESESRAAVWARVAARSMKLSLCHRCARMDVAPANAFWDSILLEIQDVNWGIKLSNWLARIACGLVRENTIDKSLSKAKTILAQAIEKSSGPVNSRDILRTFRGISAGDLAAAAIELGLVVRRDKTKGRPKVMYEKPTNSLAD